MGAGLVKRQAFLANMDFYATPVAFFHCVTHASDRTRREAGEVWRTCAVTSDHLGLPLVPDSYATQRHVAIGASKGDACWFENGGVKSRLFLEMSAAKPHEPETGVSPRGEVVPPAPGEEREQPTGGQRGRFAGRHDSARGVRQPQSDCTHRLVPQASSN